MNIIKRLKDNLFVVIVIFSYIAIFILNPQMGMSSVNNSGYYIKEMLMIMPAIFVLTALLDMWISKEKIMKYLGENSKSKGILLSFALGSISAGPIYAAFPFCIMLLKKGASIRNIVIILSSWAVIKVPMLLTEVKFLGFKFMLVRYLLTLIAIVLFSWVTAKLVKISDIPLYKNEAKTGLYLNKNACVGCTLCTKNYPELFYMTNKKAQIKEIHEDFNTEKLSFTISACPVKAIEYVLNLSAEKSN